MGTIWVENPTQQGRLDLDTFCSSKPKLAGLVSRLRQDTNALPLIVTAIATHLQVFSRNSSLTSTILEYHIKEKFKAGRRLDLRYDARGNLCADRRETTVLFEISLRRGNELELGVKEFTPDDADYLTRRDAPGKSSFYDARGRLNRKTQGGRGG
jgi:hypothetical protein